MTSEANGLHTRVPGHGCDLDLCQGSKQGATDSRCLGNVSTLHTSSVALPGYLQSVSDIC